MEKTDQDGLYASWLDYYTTFNFLYETDHIISLDADGFTVGDGTGSTNWLNILNIVYTYIAIGAQGPSNFKTGTYVGDGNVTQAITGLGFQPKYVNIYWIANGASLQRNRLHKTDADPTNNAMFQWIGSQNWYLTNMLVSLDADGFTVGDGGFSDFNINTAVYVYLAFG